MEIDDWVEEVNGPKNKFGDFSNYRIDPNPIGSGGFSKVYRVQRDGRYYAMKIPTSIQVEDTNTIKIEPSSIAEFKTEARNWALASKNVPDSVIQLIDYNTEPFPWMVMELAEESYKDRLVERKGTVQDIIDILKGLDKVHSAGLIHRDLKPENILRVKNQWKLTDFGLSKVMNSISISTSGIKGTPQYLAPEQISKKMFGNIDQRTDIWQVGILLYETLTGKLPYPTVDFAELGMIIISDGPDLKSAPDRFVPILSKALCKDKEGRYQTAAEFANALIALTAPDQNQPVPKEVAEPRHTYAVPETPVTKTENPPASTARKGMFKTIAVTAIIFIVGFGIGYVIMQQFIS